jgi:hypothetical protein
MTKLKLLSAALIAAAMLATPAVARESHVSSRHPAENVNAGARYLREVDGVRGHESRDVWHHWGTYYGPMIPSSVI